LAQAFVAQEEERFVFLDWTSKRGAKLVAFKRGHRLANRVKEISGVKVVVANEFEQFAVKCIGT